MSEVAMSRAEYTVVEATEDQLEVFMERHSAALAEADESDIIKDAGSALTEAFASDAARLNGELLRLCERVVDANGCKDALERVARDVTERAQRQMIRNHYENERRGAREEARQEVIQVLSPIFAARFDVGNRMGGGSANRRNVGASPQQDRLKKDDDVELREPLRGVRLNFGESGSQRWLQKIMPIVERRTHRGMLAAAALSVIALCAWYGGGMRGARDADDASANPSQRQTELRDGTQGTFSAGGVVRDGGGGKIVKAVAQVVSPPEDLPSPSSPPRLGEDEGAMHDSVTRVECETSKGHFFVDLHSQWAPRGVERFLDMLDGGFFKSNVAFYRVVPGFVAQFGIPGDPQETRFWDSKPALIDDKQSLDLNVRGAFKKGMLSFAGSGPNSRRTELFFSLSDSNHLGKSPWETPIGYVSDPAGLNVLDSLFTGYGDLTIFGGRAPDHTLLRDKGGAWWRKEYPKLDYISKCWRTQPLDPAKDGGPSKGPKVAEVGTTTAR